MEVEETTTAAPPTAPTAVAQVQTVKKVVTRKRFKRSVSKVSFASMTKTFDFIYIQELKQARRRPLRKLEM